MDTISELLNILRLRGQVGELSTIKINVRSIYYIILNY